MSLPAWPGGHGSERGTAATGEGDPMRAMILRHQQPVETAPLELVEVPPPAPATGEVLLRVHACGACHTDLHIVEGDLPLHRCPVIVGHQIVGTIVEVGAGVDGGRVGERVGVPWISSSCGRCRHCLAGAENLCGDARFTGYDVDGGYAELAVAPAGAAHALPGSYSDADASLLLCAGIIGFRSLRLSEIRPGGRLGLFGFGASAHIALQVALHRGCEVHVFTRGEEHRRVALDLGAAWAGPADDSATARLDAAITFAPIGSVVAAALRKLDRGGTLAINAIWLDGLPAMGYTEHLYGERTVRSVTNLTQADAREFLELAGRLPLKMVVETFPLEEANDVLLRMKESRLDAAAALVVG